MSFNELKKLTTPSFILNKKVLDSNYDLLEKSFKKYWNNIIIGYSYKTNSLPWLINYLKEKKAWAEVVSNSEYRLAKSIGYSSNQIILNGPYKGFDSMLDVLNNEGIVNIDSFHEVEWLINNIDNRRCDWNIGIRVNFDLETNCPGESLMGAEGSRFGINLENGDLKAIVDRLQKIKGINITGLHLHNSTRTKSLNVYKTLSKTAIKVAKMFSLNLKYVDIGGGFFGDKPNAPTYEQYAEVIGEELNQYFHSDQVALIIEPGISLAASCFDFICEVIDVKQIKNNHIITTNGSNIYLDPQENNRKFSYEILASKEKKSSLDKQIICGFTCMEKDRFMTLLNEKKLSIGDIISVKNAGAYTLSLSPLFIEYFPYVYLNDNSHYSIIRSAWDEQDYSQKCKLK